MKAALLHYNRQKQGHGVLPKYTYTLFPKVIGIIISSYAKYFGVQWLMVITSV
jgi:hypothetical protein